MRKTSNLQGRTNFLRSLIQIESGKPAIAQGLRTAVAVGVPLLIGLLVGRTAIGMTIALGALLVSLTDVGGPYRTKATAMGTATLGVAVSALVGTLVGRYPSLAIPLMFLWGFGAGEAGVYGNTAAIVGLVVAVSFLSGISLPGDFVAALQCFVQFIVGGAWAMVLSLVAWPLKPYQPLRDAIADCYRSIAVFIAASDEIIAQGPVAESDRWERTTEREQRVRNALEVARNGLIATRITQQGTSTIGDQLLVLFQMADRIFGEAIALAQVLETTTDPSQITKVHLLVKDALKQIAEVTRALSKAISSGRSTAVDTSGLDYTIAAIREERRTLPAALRDHRVDYPYLRDISNLIQMVEKLSQQVHAAVGTVKCLCAGYWRISDGQVPSVTWDRAEVVAPLRANLTLHSVVLRHALRLGVTAAFSVMVYTVFDLPQGFWIALTVIVILKPDFGGTFKRAFQRVGGTIFGGFLAAVLAATISSKFVLAIVIVLLTFATMSLLPVNYGFAVVFITPLVVLLTNLAHPGNWQIAGVRILDTIFGGALALLGGYMLWPSWERQRLPDQLAHTIHANRIYCQRVLAAYLNREGTQAIWEARRRAELENANAEASFQRLLSEPKKYHGSVSSVMVVVTYTRRFSDTLTTLFAHLNEFSGRHELPALETFAQQTEHTLSDLADAVGRGCLPQALPPLDVTLDAIHAHLEKLYTLREAELTANRVDTPTRRAVLDYALVSMLLDRIADQVTVMHESAYSNVQPRANIVKRH